MNTTDQENEINLFEGLAEVGECEILEVDDVDKVEEGEEFFENSGYAPAPPPAIIRDTQSKEGQLLYDILKKVKDEEDITEPTWGLNLMESELTLDQRKSYAMIIHQFSDIFAKYDEDLGRTHWVRHAIDTGDAIPIKGKAYGAPLTLRTALEEMIAAMEEQAW